MKVERAPIKRERAFEREERSPWKGERSQERFKVPGKVSCPRKEERSQGMTCLMEGERSHER